MSLRFQPVCSIWASSRLYGEFLARHTGFKALPRLRLVTGNRLLMLTDGLHISGLWYAMRGFKVPVHILFFP